VCIPPVVGPAISEEVVITAVTDPSNKTVTWSGDVGDNPQISGNTLRTRYGTPGEKVVTATCDQSSRSVRVRVVTLTSQTVATTPTNRSRLTIGVAEEVVLTSNPSTPVTWTVAGGGTVSPASGTSTTFTAGETATTSTITATFAGGGTCEITFTVIAPNGVMMTAASFLHLQGTASAGFIANPIKILPATVSFYRIEVQEGVAVGVGTGYYAGFNGIGHVRGPFLSVRQDNVVNGNDTVCSSNGQPPFAVGQFSWPIPWEYRSLGATTLRQIAIVEHLQVATATGRVTMSKGGTSVTRNPGDPTEGGGCP
jgi:hypothetical protein